MPLRWYDEYEHIGYSVDGKKIMKQNAGDTIDQAIAARDDPNYSRTVYDAYNDRKVVLSDRDLELLRRIQSGAFAHPEFQAYPELVDYYTSDKLETPMAPVVDSKSSFLPSKWEKMKVMKIIKGIAEGRIQLNKPQRPSHEAYMIWKEDDTTTSRKGLAHVPAPKMPLPGHAESYNPPEEYLYTEEERQAWEAQDPEDRALNFIPQKFDSLRAVAGFPSFVRERFERCLDLYLCPRVNKRRLNIDPESLVPTLPKPRDLRPFPNALALVFRGHGGRIRSLAMGPVGQYFASGSDDGTVRLWEVDTSRCVHVWNVGGVVTKVVWNPNPDHHVLAVVTGHHVLLLATGTGNQDQQDLTNALLGDAQDTLTSSFCPEKKEESMEEPLADVGGEAAKSSVTPVTWTHFTGTQLPTSPTSPSSSSWMQDKAGTGIRLVLRHLGEVRDVAWHAKGDYLSTVTPACESRAVLIHQISKRQTQNPFRKVVGRVQGVCFHPTKPFLFHATQTHVRIYHLVKQQLTKKLSSGVKWISSMAIHPSGDHLLLGSYDRRLCWFDLDLSSKAYKTLKYHEKAVRQVAYHPRYPLMASASDDGTIHIFHAMVYSDLLKNPLIVPLKILRGHEVSSGLGVLTIAFHPTLPWIASGGADGTIRLFQSVH